MPNHYLNDTFSVYLYEFTVSFFTNEYHGRLQFIYSSSFTILFGNLHEVICILVSLHFQRVLFFTLYNKCYTIWRTWHIEKKQKMHWTHKVHVNIIYIRVNGTFDRIHQESVKTTSIEVNDESIKWFRCTIINLSQQYAKYWLSFNENCFCNIFIMIRTLYIDQPTTSTNIINVTIRWL